ncbi:hypothetical protein [Acidovorax sp. Root275]|uniref:hypothetical protein n=1 Tax=Acidovorax sp. Root275 TaxID=1736508 RepID=UPI00130111A4|nr:hypothetical protein [Acidovorax sp. Root275]
MSPTAFRSFAQRGVVFGVLLAASGAFALAQEILEHVEFLRLQTDKLSPREWPNAEYVVRTQQQWDEIWAMGKLEPNPRDAESIGTPKVDFSQFTLVGVSRGKQSHGCTSLNIKFVIRRGKRIDVHFTDPENARRTYGAMTVCPAVVTYLNDWVLIPRTPRHSVIRFVDSQSMR